MAADGFADWEDSFDGAPEDETLEEALAEERTLDHSSSSSHGSTTASPPRKNIFLFFKNSSGLHPVFLLLVDGCGWLC